MKRKKHTRWAFLRPLQCAHRPQSNDCAPRPANPTTAATSANTSALGQTALMNFDGLALAVEDSFLFAPERIESDRVHSTSSDSPVNPAKFPYWEDPEPTPYEDTTLSTEYDIDEDDIERNEQEQLKLSLTTILGPGHELLDVGKNLQDYGQDSENQFVASPVKINVLTTDAVDPCTPPPRDIRPTRTSRSNHRTPQTIQPSVAKSQISLEQYMEDRKKPENNPPPLDLGCVSSYDGTMSASSNILEVNFDNDYPQLVLVAALQPDDACSRLTSESTLGIAFAHPASGDTQSVSSLGNSLKGTMCSPQDWLNDNIDRVWNHFDRQQQQYDEKQPKLRCRNTNLEKKTNCTDPKPTERSLRNTKVSPATEWEYADWTSVATFSSMLEREVVQPILRPICRFVDATEVPDTFKCQKQRRSRTPLHEKRDHGPSYRMSPQMRKHQSRRAGKNIRKHQD